MNLVYPKTNPVKINSESTFFIGSTNPADTLKINDMDVKISPLGAFAQIVPLNVGINNFKITSHPKNINDANAEIDFVIERPKQIVSNQTASTLIEYPIMTNFYVKTDNVPLRMTPIDEGINRISHLSKETRLLVNGEKSDFYRVYLNSKLNGWILKSNIEQRENEKIENSYLKISGLKTKEKNKFCIYEIDLDGNTELHAAWYKIPFALKEENGLTLQLFNIDSQVDNTYVLNIPAQKLMGYDTYYDGEKFILKVRKIPQIDVKKPLKNIIIAVDAGHGGSELGAIGCCGDKEKDINLAIAKNLRQELENRGAKVIMTREEDVDLPLEERVKTARDKNAALLVSIHANALPDGADPNKNKGTSVYYYHNQAKSLAENILNSMTTQLGTQNDKIRQKSLALVRPTSSVSVLIEVAYMINPDDYALLSDTRFQINCAKAIADGIEKYILE